MKKQKFKVGDRVRDIKDGELGEIMAILEGRSARFKTKWEHSGYSNMTEDRLELVQEPQPFEDKSASEQGKYFIVKAKDSKEFAGKKFGVKNGDLLELIDSPNYFKDLTRELTLEACYMVLENVRPATQSEIDAVLDNGQDYMDELGERQEKLGKKLLTHNQFLEYIKKHGPTKARITEDWHNYKRGEVYKMKVYDNPYGEDGIKEINNSVYFFPISYKGKFELVEETSQPFEDKSAEEQGIDTSRYFTVLEGDSCFKRGCLVRYLKLGGLDYPMFQRVEKGDNTQHTLFWNELRYATQSEIDEVLGEKEAKRQDDMEVEEQRKSETMSRGEEKIEVMTVAYTVDLEAIEKHLNHQSIIKKTMNSITNFIKNATLSAEEKLLRENGLKDSCGNYTEAYEDVRDFLLNQEYETKVVEQLKKKLEAEKEK